MNAGEGIHVNLSKLQRCDQLWATMPVIPGGRLCQQCDKRIVDFTRMNAVEIARTHMDSEAPVCGMYRDEQLRPPERPIWKETGWRSHPMMLSLVSMLLLEPTTSEASPRTPDVEVAQPPVADDHTAQRVAQEDNPRQDSVIVRGRVVEVVGSEDEPVPFVNVMVKGTALGALTDFDGYFTLDLTAMADSTEQVVLVMSYVGFQRIEQEVSLVDPKEVLFRVTNAEKSLIVFSVSATKPPLYKRIWWGMQRPFRK